MKHKCSICNGTEEHSFAYESVENGNAIKATCSDCGATYTVKLTQPAAKSDEKIVYDGTEKKAGTAIDSGNTGIETIPENAITYAAVTNGTTSTYSTAAPKNAGTYKAKLTLGTGDNRVSIEINFTIEKAASPTIAGEEKSYAYSVGSDGKTIGVDIAGKLPTDRGTTTYAVAKTDTEQLLSEVAVDTAGNLTYKVNQVDSTKVGKTAIITVTASMENYENAEYTLTISSITDKKTVEIKSGNTVSVDGSNVLTYGEKVSKLTLGNTVFVEAGTDNKVEGILSWSNPDEIPATGTTQAGWIFKPTDSRHYVELTGTAAITVAKATPIVVKVPTVAEREYNPDAALTDSDMTGGSVTGADGSSLAGTWSFTGTNIIPTVNNKGYQAVFTPNDTNNYNTVTRTITVKVTKATPVIAEKPTAGALTYGQKLSDSTLTGGKAAYQTADGTEITGTFAWKNDTTKPAVVDSQKTEYDVTFTPSDKDNYNAVDTKLTLSINKAAAPTNIPSGTLNIINGTYQTYTYDFAQLLPELSEGEYGTVSYGNQPAISLVSQSGYYYDPTIVEFHNGVLTLAQFYAKDGTMTGQIGTVKVKVTTTNYEDFQLTLVLNAVNQIKPTPDGTITASDITYGQTLSESTIKGKMKDDGKTVEGTFGWTNPSTQPDKAGDYQAEWTFTPAAGYEKYATVTGTVTVKVNKADPTFTAPTAQENLTYTGQEQALIIAGSVKDYGPTMQYSLTENGTYSQDIPTGTDAGAYTVWYRVIGDENHNDTAPASVAVSIRQKPLTITEVTAASKTYDGTTNAGITSVTFDNVTLNRDTDYNVTASFDDASAGNGKNVTATVTLIGPAAKNYALEQSSFTTTGSITKAAAPDFTKETPLVIINDYEKTYTVTLPALPTLEKPKEYGAPTYELGEIKLNDGYYTSGAKVENGELTLPIQKNDVKTTGSVGTATVVIKSTNYEDITLTVNVSAVNKIKPTPVGEITASEITYGDTLSKSKISGKMKDLDTGKEVEGTFAWPYPYDKPSQTGDYNVTWIFTPAKGYEEYETVTGIVKVPVAPKSIEGATITLEKYEFAYNAKEQSPKVTRVTLENWDKTRITYDIKGGGKATDASDRITLTIEGTGNYTGTATAEWKIIPAKLTVGVSSVKKEYDGTANATVTPTFNGLQGGENLTAADYSVTAAFDNAKVGYNKTVTGKVTLNQTDTAKNYVLTNNGNFSTDDGTIAKAAAPTVQPVELTIYNGVQRDYYVDLPPLPELGEGKSYGTEDYRKPHMINLSEGYTAQSMLAADSGNLNTLRLMLRMNQTGSLTGEIGTVTIPVETSNYQDINLTVKVKAVNQTLPEKVGTVSADAITYGQTLSASTITGTMQDPATGNAVNGTFTWDTPAVKLNAGSHDAKWTFTPDKSYGGKYTTNTGTATVTVNPKAVTVSITPNGGTYGSVTAAAAELFGAVEGDNVAVTLTYTGTANDGTKYNGTTPPTKAGTYTIKASITDDNYTLDADTATAEFTVAKRSATVTPDNKSKVYEEKDPDLTYKVDGVLDVETLKGITLTRAEGENAGEYAITATADAGANPNYDVTFAEGTLTIEPKSIQSATVVLGKALTANGAEQTQTVEKVLLDGKELPADSYTVTDNTATAPGSHTLTITAKGNYTGTVKQTYVIVPAKAEDAPGEDITIGSGKVKVDVQSEGTVPPATLLTDKAELLAMLVNSGDITADELAQIADGANVDIVLTVKEANDPGEVKTAMAQAAKDYTIGQHLDISLLKYMTVNGSQQTAVALRTTKNALTISVVVPDALINTNSAVNRTYCIVRNHEGTIDVLDAAFDAASKTLTFKTDRFSIYAIAYKDTAVPSSGSNPGSNNSSNGSETKKNEVAAPTPAPTPASTSKPSTITAMPQTGDTSNPTLYVVLLVASLLGLAVVFACKKRNDK